MIAGFALPVLGEWPGWMTVLVVFLAVVQLLPRLIHLADRGPVEPDPVEHRSRHDVSSMVGWDEYVIGQRLEREVAPDIDPSGLDIDREAGWSS